jgi:predicted oxidoreductase (fatty acid repression mutant protein)
MTPALQNQHTLTQAWTLISQVPVGGKEVGKKERKNDTKLHSTKRN